MIDQRVVKAAEYLDRIFPGWQDKVDTHILDMDSPTKCILGQVFEHRAVEYGSGDGYAYGMNNLIEFNAHMVAFGALEGDWIALLNERKNPTSIKATVNDLRAAYESNDPKAALADILRQHGNTVSVIVEINEFDKQRLIDLLSAADFDATVKE